MEDDEMIIFDPLGELLKIAEEINEALKDNERRINHELQSSRYICR